MKLINEFIMERLKQDFSERAGYFDGTPAFPHENFNQIVNLKLHTINLSRNYGGYEFGIESTCDFLIEVASACPATALCLAMHYYSLGGFKSILSADLKKMIFTDIWENGQFVASISNPNIIFVHREEDIRSLTSLHCRKEGNGYVVNGSKYFVSGSPRIKYLPLYCYQENARSRNKITALIADMNSPGITVDESWNYAGMRATMSHTVHFENVFIPDSYLIGREGYGIDDTQQLIFWFRLALVSVYHGIARAAYEYVLNYIKKKRDPISNKLLALLPGIQFSVADMSIQLETSYSQIKICAKQADMQEQQGNFTDDLYIKTLVTKQYVTKVSNEVVWQAMQVQGTSSMVKGSLLERLYRDVRAATFHPPGEDLLKEVIAKKTLGIISINHR